MYFKQKFRITQLKDKAQQNFFSYKVCYFIATSLNKTKSVCLKYSTKLLAIFQHSLTLIASIIFFL